MKTPLYAAAVLALASTATPALAQADQSDHFDGAYVSVIGGRSNQNNDFGETIQFDTNRDGAFDENVVTVAGANAFAPGFCNGAATSATPDTGCTNDKDDWEYYGRVGVDNRMGNTVVGFLVEGGRTEARDAVTAFSSTPASYTFSRSIDYEIAARARVGYTPNGGVLFYATGGGAYAKLDNRFTTTNTANSFDDNGRTNGWGYQVGGGAEAMVGSSLSLGLEYLYTSLNDDDYVVNVGPGTAAATNPFLLNGGGTNFKRSEDDFNRHSVRVTASLRF